ncbi:lipopolysaccharide biosynthesis protein [Gracilimonas mengyeensis]|uniref:Membrane protein involved in the export of O-antigen and teichoic acid n=1 Tax=Gracilimonas mengyeensis TaxID=1302730 RepID=A0A521CRH6_9BACT|nr:polysaccharide biosynthesis C-terminal domain-containing protein [Gracilimonas mengyeensis]SMO62008.1 Membrane protein involved in the export of O-antigen and teichoic acid [Gracilimonas mengyeensis]
MTKLKELFSDTIVYGISSVLARFIGYLLVPLHTGVFQEDQYGVISLVFAAIAFFNVIFQMGMESAYIRYGKDRDKAKSIFKTLQLFLLGSSAILVAIIWLAQPLIAPLVGLETGDPILWMLLGILFFDTLAIVPFAELRLVRKSISFAIIKTGNVLINLGLNFYLILGLNYGIEAVFISNLVASLLTAIATALMTLPLFKGSWDTDFLKKALLFGLPFIPAGFGHAINELVDRFFLKSMDPSTVQQLYGQDYTSDDIVGIYGACYKLAVFMLLIVQMFRMAWQPFFMRQSEEQSAPQTFAQTFSFFNLAAAAVFLFVALFVEQIVSIKIPILDFYLVDEKFWEGLIIVPVLLMAYWFQGWYINFSAGIFISETTKRLAQITLMGAAITIIANLALIPYFGMMGSAIATLISYASMALLIFYYSTKAFSVPYNLLSGFGVMVIVAGLYYLKPSIISFGLNEWAASLLLFISGLLAAGGITYASVKSI